MSAKPLAVDLFCGLGGWSEGLLAEGWRVIGYDTEAHQYGEDKYPASLILQDVLTIDGSQFKDASLIVASPPCTEFSYMAMPWQRGKQIANALRGKAEFPKGYHGARTIADLTALFDACFRIQREAWAAAGGCHVPMVVENVRGAQPWVGKARWNFGSYYLWGDVPALMPLPLSRAIKNPENSGWLANGCNSENRMVPSRFKSTGMNWSDQTKRGQDFTRLAGRHCARIDGIKNARNWWSDGKGNLSAVTSSKSPARKAASALIAKIPFSLARWIAKVYYPKLILT